MNGTAEEQQAEVAVLPVIDIGIDELQSVFAEIMDEWGFADSPVRLPTLAEARAVLARSPYAA
jgi:hypothetical protein